MLLPSSFSNYFMTLLSSAYRDASYTTQPLELLNDLGFNNSNAPKHPRELMPDVDGVHVNSTGNESVSDRKFDANEVDGSSHMVDNGAAPLQDSEVSEGD